MERGDYLENHWLSYPAAPRGANWALGRFERLGSEFALKRFNGREIEVRTFKIPEHFEVLSSKDLPKSMRAAAFLGALRAGDWVAFQAGEGANSQILLLAPNLSVIPVETGTSAADPTLKPVALAFAEFREELKLHFKTQNFLEIATPTLVPCPGTEVFLDVFSTEFSPGTPRQQRFYLPTSPELHLKKALSAGAEKIFELRPCFRNGEISQKHRPEFWMLEWYRAFADLEDIKQDCRELVTRMSGLKDLKFSEVSVAELFSQLGLQLTPQTSVEDLKSWCRRLGLKIDGYELWDDLFYLIFVDRIENFLPSAQPLFVVDYPPSQAALARVNERGWADRFELYWRGYEIANAYFELNDPVEQRRRSLEDLRKREDLGRQPLTLDEGFFQALESGMPPSAGIALGAERLMMASRGIKDIGQLSQYSI
jgi:lysyl-tRNA synthetase class 2